jgi:hypothetical protein
LDKGAEESREKVEGLNSEGLILGAAKQQHGTAGIGQKDALQREVQNAVGESCAGSGGSDEVEWNASGRVKGLSAKRGSTGAIPWATKRSRAQAEMPAEDVNKGDEGKGSKETEGRHHLGDSGNSYGNGRRTRIESVPGGFSRLAGQMETRDTRFDELGPYESLTGLSAVGVEHGGGEEVFGDYGIADAFEDGRELPEAGTLRLEGFDREVEQDPGEPPVAPDDAPEQLDLPEGWLEADQAAEAALLRSVQGQQAGADVVGSRMNLEVVGTDRMSDARSAVDAVEMCDGTAADQEQLCDDMKRSTANIEMHEHAIASDHVESARDDVLAVAETEQQPAGQGNSIRVAADQVPSTGEALAEALPGTQGEHVSLAQDTFGEAVEGSGLSDADEYEEGAEDGTDWLFDDEDGIDAAAVDADAMREAVSELRREGFDFEGMAGFDVGDVEMAAMGATNQEERHFGERGSVMNAVDGVPSSIDNSVANLGEMPSVAGSGDDSGHGAREQVGGAVVLPPKALGAGMDAAGTGLDWESGHRVGGRISDAQPGETHQLQSAPKSCVERPDGDRSALSSQEGVQNTSHRGAGQDDVAGPEGGKVRGASTMPGDSDVTGQLTGALPDGSDSDDSDFLVDRLFDDSDFEVLGEELLAEVIAEGKLGV